jgi:sporulation protein YlmC with PRC-barrel domain
VGRGVRNVENEDIGKIEEIMLDLPEGRVSCVVLSFGGSLGTGEKFYAIPIEELSIDADGKKVVVNAPKDRLKNAPGFDKDQWPESTDRRWLASVYDYYGCRPYWMPAAAPMER